MLAEASLRVEADGLGVRGQDGGKQAGYTALFRILFGGRDQGLSYALAPVALEYHGVDLRHPAGGEDLVVGPRRLVTGVSVTVRGRRLLTASRRSGD